MRYRLLLSFVLFNNSTAAQLTTVQSTFFFRLKPPESSPFSGDPHVVSRQTGDESVPCEVRFQRV